MITYLIAKGAEGISEGEIISKSRKELKEENRSVTDAIFVDEYISILIILLISLRLQVKNRD
jgi:hypothetical protein